MDVSSPHQIVFLENVKVARVSCGENHSAFLTGKYLMHQPIYVFKLENERLAIKEDN